MTEVTELKPCPFCGSKAEIYDYDNVCHVHCTGCDAKTADYYAFSDTQYNGQYALDAIRSWNNRVTASDMLDEISQTLQDAGFEEASKWLDCAYEI